MTLLQARAQLGQHLDVGGNAIEYVGIHRSAAGHLLYFVSFAAQREWYREASQATGACDDPHITDVRHIGRFDIIPGIELGVKGMPTGVSVDPPITGYAGYWGNFHVLILDNRLKFDEGRKTPVGRRMAMYRDCADDVLFNQYKTEIISAAIKDAVVPYGVAQMTKSRTDFIEKRLKNRTLLNFSRVKQENTPRHEEDVVILFHEMIVSGAIPYYRSLDSASNSTYDEIFRYKIPKNRVGFHVQTLEGTKGTLEEQIIVEYKLKGESLIDDCQDDVKFYYMMDVMICWSVSAAECRKKMATLIPKPPNQVRYWGVTHELKLSPAHFKQVGSGRSFDVICLQDLIAKLAAETYDVP